MSGWREEARRFLDALRKSDPTLPEWEKAHWPGTRHTYGEPTAGANCIEAAEKHLNQLEEFAMKPHWNEAMFSAKAELDLVDIAPMPVIQLPEVTWLTTRRRALVMGRALEVARYALALAQNRDMARHDALLILAEFETLTGTSVRQSK